MSGTECNWHCRWKARHSDKCLLLLMSKARICELWGCFEGIACSEMCDFVLCSSFFPFIDFNCWSLPFPAVHEPCNLPWSHPGPRSSLDVAEADNHSSRCWAGLWHPVPSSMHRGHGTLVQGVGRAPCVSGREGGKTLTRLCLLSCSAQGLLPHASQGGSLCCLSCAPGLLVLPAPGLPFFPQPGFIGLDCAPINLLVYFYEELKQIAFPLMHFYR